VLSPGDANSNPPDPAMSPPRIRPRWSPRRSIESLKTGVRHRLYRDLFSLPEADRRLFQFALTGDPLHRAFADRGCRLGADLKLVCFHARRWTLSDRRTVYLVKDAGNGLIVYRELHPRVCRLLETVYVRLPLRVRQSTLRLRRWCFQEACMLRKRWPLRPRALRINLGAGNWFVRGWRVLDHQGHWYRFAPGFIDFPHDLTSLRPFPFADGSVDLFYCEHVFEHLNDACCARAFREAYRCLKAGGGFRTVVPDADLIYAKLRANDAEFFRRWTERDNIGLSEAFRVLIGHARSPLDEEEFGRRLATMPPEAFLDWCKAGLEYDLRRAGEHINWFNFAKLARLLREAGFPAPLRSDAQRSVFAEIRGPRFDTRAWYSLHVDCVKPYPS
jgi:SAM-dependent methyltransferase